MIQADIERYIHRIEAKTEVSSLARKYVEEMLRDIPKEDMEEVAKKALLLAVEETISKHPEDVMDRKRSRNEGMKTLVISLGRRDRLTVPILLGMINEVTRGERVDVGHIQLGEKEASFEVPPNFIEKLCRAMSACRFKGQRVSVREGSQVKRSEQSRRHRGKRKVSRF